LLLLGRPSWKEGIRIWFLVGVICSLENWII
jgi:hypothetical protein